MIKCKLFKPRLPAQKEHGISSQNDRNCWRLYPKYVFVMLPNKKSQYHFNRFIFVQKHDSNDKTTIQIGIVVVEISQEYSTQKYDNPIDLEYLFVFNKYATVSKMIVEIGDEKKFGIIREKEEAQNDYEEEIKQGQTMAYSDQEEQMPEIKKVKIGSLAPNKKSKVTFEYAQPLEVFFGKLSFHHLQIHSISKKTINIIIQHITLDYPKKQDHLFKYLNLNSIVNKIYLQKLMMVQLLNFQISNSQIINTAVKEDDTFAEPKKLTLILEVIGKNKQENFIHLKTMNLTNNLFCCFQLMMLVYQKQFNSYKQFNLNL